MNTEKLFKGFGIGNFNIIVYYAKLLIQRISYTSGPFSVPFWVHYEIILKNSLAWKRPARRDQKHKAES